MIETQRTHHQYSLVGVEQDFPSSRPRSGNADRGDTRLQEYFWPRLDPFLRTRGRIQDMKYLIDITRVRGLNEWLDVVRMFLEALPGSSSADSRLEAIRHDLQQMIDHPDKGKIDDIVWALLSLHQANSGEGVKQVRRMLQATMTYRFRIECDLRGRKAEFVWSYKLLDDLKALSSPARSDELQQRMGNMLRQFLGKAGWDVHEARIVQALGKGESVHLTIQSHAAEMFLLPWELLTIKATGQHIGERENLFLGYAWPGTRTASQVDQQSIGRILLAWSSAGGKVPLGRHQKALKKHFESFDHGDIVAHASLRYLKEALEKPHDDRPPASALHLLCHGQSKGSSFGLSLNGPDGAGEVWISPSDLRRVMGPHARHVKLVVLSVCHAGDAGGLGTHLGSVAQALHRIGIKWVIAPRYSLSLPGSIEFTKVFYNQPLGSGSVEKALSAARRELMPYPEYHDWRSLQLYVRHKDRPGPASICSAIIDYVRFFADIIVRRPWVSGACLCTAVGSLIALFVVLNGPHAVIRNGSSCVVEIPADTVSRLCGQGTPALMLAGEIGSTDVATGEPRTVIRREWNHSRNLPFQITLECSHGRGVKESFYSASEAYCKHPDGKTVPIEK